MPQIPKFCEERMNEIKKNKEKIIVHEQELNSINNFIDDLKTKLNYKKMFWLQISGTILAGVSTTLIIELLKRWLYAGNTFKIRSKIYKKF